MTSCGRELRFEKQKAVGWISVVTGNVTNPDGKCTLTEGRPGHLQSTRQRWLSRSHRALAYVIFIDLQS